MMDRNTLEERIGVKLKRMLMVSVHERYQLMYALRVPERFIFNINLEGSVWLVASEFIHELTRQFADNDPDLLELLKNIDAYQLDTGISQ